MAAASAAVRVTVYGAKTALRPRSTLAVATR
jgi:hypothetical protein